jgi:hypothetical protein
MPNNIILCTFMYDGKLSQPHTSARCCGTLNQLSSLCYLIPSITTQLNYAYVALSQLQTRVRSTTPFDHASHTITNYWRLQRRRAHCWGMHRLSVDILVHKRGRANCCPGRVAQTCRGLQTNQCALYFALSMMQNILAYLGLRRNIIFVFGPEPLQKAQRAQGLEFCTQKKGNLV